MAKKVREKTIDSSTERAKLRPSGKPYWRGIGKGLHLGYRRGLTGGKWVLRRHLGGEKYTVTSFAEADDHLPADGVHVLDFYQAQDKAREIAGKARETATPAALLTVNAALDAYFERLEHEASKSLADARGRAGKHIRPALGDKLVAGLTRDILSQWHRGLAEKARDGNAGDPSQQRDRNDADARRRRQASANRVFTILRAALNQAFSDGKVDTGAAWRAVKPFREVDAPRLRYFTKDEVRRLINAAQGDFRDLVKAALFTGCRYGELTRLRAGDFNPDSGTVFVGQSKSGKARHVVLTDEGRKFFESLIAGQPGDALMLSHVDGSSWGASHQIRPMAEVCRAASITPAASFHIIRHTAASHWVMSGVPLHVTAHNLGHADTRMTEKHYAHLAPSYIVETIRKFAPDFGTADDSNIVSIGAAARTV